MRASRSSGVALPRPPGRRPLPGHEVDPVALLAREHQVILQRLHLIELAVAPRPDARGARTLDRATLRELLDFFTDRVSVHFEREAVLISALSRALSGSGHGRAGFESLLAEHRALKAEALRLAGRLEAGRSRAAGAEAADLARLRAFVRHYRTHIAWEERILFLLARVRLTDEQRARIGDRMLAV
jgi:hemerythrin-like domain-containing protein